jgi:hypothetical protein
MLKRAFLLVFGSVAPLALLGGGALGGCQTVVVDASGGGGAGAHGAGASGTGGFGAGFPADASIDYVDPGCPDAGPPMMLFDCDPYHQGNGACPPGDGCYIFANPPETVCGQETYGATCAPQGTGTQGDPCGSGPGGCAAGFTCVVTGAGTQCVLLCELQGAMGCPNGLVCQTIDVQGFGGCL